MNENFKNQQIDETLESLDGIQRATPGPYFFTRLSQKLQPAKGSAWERIAGWISKPVFAFGSLLIVVMLNLALVYNFTGKSERFDDVADDYSMASTTIYDYENQETE